RKGMKYAVTCANASSYSAAASSLKVSSSAIPGSQVSAGSKIDSPPSDGWSLVLPLGDEGDCIYLDASPKQKASDLDGGRCGWVMRKDFAPNLGKFGIGSKVREVDLDAHDLVHVSIELAQGFPDPIEVRRTSCSKLMDWLLVGIATPT